jgi:filamentous hemagglutinin family protein
MKRSLLLVLSAIACVSWTEKSFAQGVVGNAGTEVQKNGQQFDITGGTRAGNNLFQSLQKFGLEAGEVANFQTPADVTNLLTRVTGGAASIINGRLQITGSNANFYLLNPAGVLFGPNASLNLPAALTVTTGNGIRLGNGWFDLSNRDLEKLTGTPDAFAFSGDNGAIVNAANLSLKTGQSLTLLGGTILNTGSLSSPEGAVTIAAVPGERLVQVLPTGGVLSLRLQDRDRGLLSSAGPAVSLAELLTGGDLGNATAVVVEAGQVRLVGGVRSGDVTIQSGSDVIITDSQIEADRSLNILGDRISVAGTATSRLTSGQDLTVQSQRGGDVLVQDITLGADRNLTLRAPDGSLTLQNLNSTANQTAVNQTTLSQTTLSQTTVLDGSFVSLDGVNFSARESIKTTGRDITITNSQLRSQGTLTIQSENTIYVGESALRSIGNLDILADGANGLLAITDTIEKPITIESGNGLRLEGNSRVDIWVSNNSKSIIRSVDDLDIISNGPIYVDAKAISPDNIRFRTPDGEPARLIYSTKATGGLIQRDRTVATPAIPAPAIPAPPILPPPVIEETPDPEPPPIVEEVVPPPIEKITPPSLPELNRVTTGSPPVFTTPRSQESSCSISQGEEMDCKAQPNKLLMLEPDRPEILPPQASR